MARDTLECARCGKKIRPTDAVIYLGSGDYHTSCVIRIVKERS